MAWKTKPTTFRNIPKLESLACHLTRLSVFFIASLGSSPQLEVSVILPSVPMWAGSPNHHTMVVPRILRMRPSKVNVVGLQFLTERSGDGNQRAEMEAGIQKQTGQPSGLPCTLCSRNLVWAARCRTARWQGNYCLATRCVFYIAIRIIIVWVQEPR